MKKSIDLKQFKTRDKIGGTIRTDLFTFEDNTYTAYSFYWQDEDEECVAEASGDNPDKVVKQSRKNLRKDWREFQVWKKENPEHTSSFQIIMANGEVISSKLPAIK
jgi:hypothetical protein